MNFIKMYEKNIKKMTMLDLASVKLATAAFALFLAKMYPELLSLEPHWYVVIAIVAAAKPVMKICSK